MTTIHGAVPDIFTIDRFTIHQDPFLQEVVTLLALPTHDLRWTNMPPPRINDHNQLWFLMQSYTATEILQMAFRLSLVYERELTKLVPKKVRDSAVSKLKDIGMIDEFDLPNMGRHYKLTDKGLEFVKQSREVRS